MKTLTEKLNGGFWKWTTGVALMVVMFLLGIMAGDGLASYGVEMDLDQHSTGGPHPEQRVWNGRMELRMDGNEDDIQRSLQILEEVRDSTVRIEAQLGIGREIR